MWIQIWQSIILPFASAGFGGWLAAQFALGRFQKEKMWERKTEAYTSMFEALHDMEKWFDLHIDAEMESRQISDEQSKRLGSEYRKARDVLARRMASETWLLPDACMERIDQMNKKLSEQHGSLFDEFDSGGAELAKAVSDLKTIARADLDLIKRGWGRGITWVLIFAKQLRRWKTYGS